MEDEYTQALQTVIERNPEAGALLLGMGLQAQMAQGTSSTFRLLYEVEKERREELERQLDYWIPLGRLYLELCYLLNAPLTREGEV